MKPGSVVVWLPEPWTHGVGTVKDVTPKGWLWVEWASGHFDSYDPQHLELADEWEHQQVTTDPAFT
jgi:hypothetical protein